MKRNWNALCSMGGHVKWYNCCGKLYSSSSKNETLELPYDPAIPFLSVYTKELKAGTRTNICTSIVIAVLFTVAKKWKQPKCPLTGEWIHSQWNITQT